MSQDGNSLFVRAPAKINLFLEIIGKRSDGYHELRSIVTPISICDRLTLTKIPRDIELVTEDQGAANGDTLKHAPPESNLAVRAARALQEASGYSGGVHIHLQKRIPVGGGLGGGSADAAGVLVGLNRLWNTGLDTEGLMDIGRRLGCDVPALVHGGAVCMEGAGERISGLPMRVGRPDADWWLVVANPGFGVSTRDIYGRYKATLTSAAPSYKRMCFALEAGDVLQAAGSLFNGLQATVFRKYPLIELLAEGLAEAGAAGVLLAGSGASVFGLARDEGSARRIAECVPALLNFPAWVRVARVLPDGVMVAHGPLEA